MVKATIMSSFLFLLFYHKISSKIKTTQFKPIFKLYLLVFLSIVLNIVFGATASTYSFVSPIFITSLPVNVFFYLLLHSLHLCLSLRLIWPSGSATVSFSTFSDNSSGSSSAVFSIIISSAELSSIFSFSEMLLSSSFTCLHYVQLRIKLQ